MRKAISIASLLMVAAIMTAPMSAFAATDSETKEIKYDATFDTTEVTYSVDPTYTVTIPAKVAFNDVNQENTNALSASDIFLNHDKVVTVSVASDHAYRMTNTDTSDTESYVGYEMAATAGGAGVTVNKASFSNSDGTDAKLLATFDNGTAANKGSGTVNLTFTNDDGSNAVAGSYSDTLKFTIGVADKTTT